MPLIIRLLSLAIFRRLLIISRTRTCCFAETLADSLLLFYNRSCCHKAAFIFSKLKIYALITMCISCSIRISYNYFITSFFFVFNPKIIPFEMRYSFIFKRDEDVVVFINYSKNIIFLHHPQFHFGSIPMP